MKFLVFFLFMGSAHAQMSEWPTSVPRGVQDKAVNIPRITAPEDRPVLREVPPPPPARTYSPRPKRKVRALASNSSSDLNVPEVKSETRARVRSENKPSARDSNIYFSAFYSLSNEANYSGQATVQGQSQSYSASESTSGAFGVGGGYMNRPVRGGLGYSALLSYEFARQAKSLSGQVGGRSLTSDYQGGYGMSLFTASGNALYAVDSQIYFYGGINYPYLMSENSNVKLNGLPGYQLGAGYSITSNLGVHLEYRVIRMKGSLNMSPTALQIQSGQLPAFVLSFDYSI